MQTTLDHVNIVVSDIERSVDFYQRFLNLSRGFEVRLEGAWIETVTGIAGSRAHCVFMEASGGSARLELLQYLTLRGSATSLSPSTISMGS
jgi:catechol 2,3-dioxygenase-like lactoylglutathione lyase family enzyme